MSTQITTAFSQQFSANVQLLSQQMGSVLRGGVSEESVTCLLYTSPSPRDGLLSRMPSSA